MPDEKLQYVIDIIRESADFDTEREEIDIEIDKIDTVTQRKLQNFVLKQRGKTQKNKPAPASPEREGGRGSGRGANGAGMAWSRRSNYLLGTKDRCMDMNRLKIKIVFA